MVQKETANFSLTKEQIMYYVAKRKLEKLKGRDDQAAIDESKRIKTQLWKSICKFVKSEINHMMGAYSTEEERIDVEQECALKFFIKLPSYDPLRATPTTFFVRYFKEVIAEYIRKNHIKLSQYDASNSRKVNAAISFYESQGIKWTTDMVATKTGLSQKVVKATIFYSVNAKTANVEDAPPLVSSILSPEEAFQEKENNSALYNAISRNVTPLELDILLLRVNAEGSKKMPYDKIAEITGIPIRKVKSILNSAICKLNQDDSLRRQFGEHTTYYNLSPLQMQDDSADIIEADILGTFNY